MIVPIVRRLDTNGGDAMPRTDRDPIRRSIEAEYWVIDEDGHLVPAVDLEPATDGVEREFVAPLIELKTTPATSTDALRREFIQRLRRVLERAAANGKKLVPLATPLTDESIDDLDSERTAIQNRVVGDDFEYVRHCAGTHVHVEQQPGRTVEQLNTFIALDPALALVNSSPYFRGRRLTAGARSELYRRMAYANLPHQGRLWPYVTSVDEWMERLEHRHEEFHNRAVDAGVDPDTFEANFGKENAVWTPVQLRPTFGTVEWRSPDTTLPSHIFRLADRLATVTDRIRRTDVRIEGSNGGVYESEIVLPEFHTVRDYVDDAIEVGIASPSVRGYLERMGFDVDAFDPISRRIDEGLAISKERARELRLEYADRLEREVRRTRVSSQD